MDTARISEVARPRRPAWQTAAVWFGGGLLLTWIAAFFFDRRRGAARRRMAVDRTLAQARDVTEWSGRKMRHVRNKAQGAIAGLASGDEEKADRAAL
jgi:hypothetical protein